MTNKVTVDAIRLLEFILLALKQGQTENAIYFVKQMLEQWPKSNPTIKSLKAENEKLKQIFTQIKRYAESQNDFALDGLLKEN